MTIELCANEIVHSGEGVLTMTNSTTLFAISMSAKENSTSPVVI